MPDYRAGSWTHPEGGFRAGSPEYQDLFLEFEGPINSASSLSGVLTGTSGLISNVVVLSAITGDLAITPVNITASSSGTYTPGSNIVVTVGGIQSGLVQAFWSPANDANATGAVELVVASSSITDGSGTVTVEAQRGEARYGAAGFLFIRNTGRTSNGVSRTMQAESGLSYVNLSGTLADTGERLTAIPDLEAGDQVAWYGVQGGAIGDVTVNIDGSFESAEDVWAFDAIAHDGDEWGDQGIQYVGDALELGGNIASVSVLTGALTVTLALSGSVTSVSGAESSFLLGTGDEFEGDIDSISVVADANLQGTSGFVGTIASISSVTGSISLRTGLEGAISSLSTASSTLTFPILALAGAVASVSSHSARLRIRDEYGPGEPLPVNSWIQYVQYGESGVSAVNSGWMIFLADQGFTVGSLNDRMFQFLRDEGYEGSLSDMMREFKIEEQIL